MKELFNDFDISTDSNAGFVLKLKKDGSLSYELQFVETESNYVHLTHKVTGETLSVTSKDDKSLLKDMCDKYIELDRNFEALRKYFE